MIVGTVVGENARRATDGRGGERMIAGDHEETDARRAALLHGLGDVHAGRIDQGDQTEESQARRREIETFEVRIDVEIDRITVELVITRELRRRQDDNRRRR